MTIGDVLAAVAAIFALGATWTATLLLIALAFPTRVGRAQTQLVASPGACLLRGLGVTLLFLIVVVPLSQHPAGPLKLLSYLLLAGLGVLAALGSAGIARLIGERIQGVGVHMSPFASLTRGTVVYVIAGFLPIIGWLFVTPIALLLSIGSGVAVLGKSHSSKEGVLQYAPTVGESFTTPFAAPTTVGAHRNAPAPITASTLQPTDGERFPA